MTNMLQYRGIAAGVAALGVVGAVVGGATVAFYGDVERSTGNTFTAGAVELRVDSVSHYNQMICTEVDDGVYQWQPEENFVPEAGHYPAAGTECDGTWAETDLEDGVHKFFNFLDLKPGDWGEDTISLHVYDNPSWGQFLIENVVDADNTCTDPEQSMEDGACSDPDGDGEIDNYLVFTGWLDQGRVAGFQCGETGPDNAMCDEDPTEGDNVYQDYEGPLFWDEDLISEISSFELAPVLAEAHDLQSCTVANGDTAYGDCHGLAEDGRMVPSVTYYLGMAWSLPLLETGNDAQTDSFSADMIFRVEQHRNNPNPFAGTVVEPEPEPEVPPVIDLEVAPTSTAASTTEKANFVASVSGDLGDYPDRTIFVDDNGSGGSFFLGTAGGQCNSDTVITDNEFAINQNRGICYQNAVEGVYTVTVNVLDMSGGSVVGTPVDVTVTVAN